MKPNRGEFLWVGDGQSDMAENLFMLIADRDQWSLYRDGNDVFLIPRSAIDSDGLPNQPAQSGWVRLG